MADANTTGADLERGVQEAITRNLPVPVLQHKDWVAQGKPRPALILNLPYASIYGVNRSRSEFGLFLPDGEMIRIECKWQAVSGSVDEKFPYLLENMKAVPEKTVVIVVSGGGAKPQAVTWLRESAARVGHKTIMVFTSQDEFRGWMQRKARGMARAKTI